MTQIDKDAFYTMKEVAELTQLNLQTVRKWRRENRLPAVKVGTRFFFSGRDLLALLSGRPVDEFED